jgi:putative ABC transport system permease protein
MAWPIVKFQDKVMQVVKQIAAVTALSLGTLSQRRGSSLVIVAGIAGVVAVLISILALSSGLRSTVGSAGRAERAVVLSRGAQSESASSIARDDVQTVLDLVGIQRDAKGKLLASADVLGSVGLPRAGTAIPGSVSLRGIASDNLSAVRPEISIVEGRMFESGLKQVIVGRAAQGRYAGLEVGKRFVSNDSEWEVVGVFTSGGDVHESEIWSDAESVLLAFHRNSFNSITAWVGSDAGFGQFKAAAAANPALTVDVHREVAFFDEQSGGFSRFLTIFANMIGAIMAVGAVFGAINAMYTAVSTRTGEIATLRAIGFGSSAIAISVFVEALLLSLAGAMIGSALAWLCFNGNSVSTLSGNGLAQVVFSVRIGFDAVMTGITWSLMLGFIGALFPAIQAAKLPVAVALRGA